MFVLIVSPYRLQVLHEHQNRSCRREVSVNQDFQIDQSETQIEHREDSIGTQWTSIPMLDLAVIKGIETSMLASATHQCVHNMPSYLHKTLQIIVIMHIIDIIDI